VPRCPIDLSPQILRNRFTTSWLVMPPGLSITRSPFTYPL